MKRPDVDETLGVERIWWIPRPPRITQGLRTTSVRATTQGSLSVVTRSGLRLGQIIRECPWYTIKLLTNVCSRAQDNYPPYQCYMWWKYDVNPFTTIESNEGILRENAGPLGVIEGQAIC